MQKTLESFDSFAEAEASEVATDRAMTPLERLEQLERLRQTHYPDGKTPPRVQRVLSTAMLHGRE